MRPALLIVDVQNDFLPGGALAVSRGDEVVPVVNRLAEAKDRFALVVATTDWHPPDHGSFASRHPGHRPGDVVDLDGLPQVLWPDHCVQGSSGAELSRALRTDLVDLVVRKGTDPRTDSYSAFFDTGRRRSTQLEARLRGEGVRDLFIAGLATDYCVLWTVRDAVSLGFDAHVVLDGCRGIDLVPGDVERAVEEMRSLGVEVLRSDALVAPKASVP